MYDNVTKKKNEKNYELNKGIIFFDKSQYILTKQFRVYLF